MKANQVKAPPEKVVLQPCCVCNKPVSAFYGTWGKSGTCSKACELEQEKKARFFFDGRE